MKMEEKEKIWDWFRIYVQTFRAAGYGGLEHIILKEEHCLRVSEEISGLAGELGLDEEEIILAEIIGLLHDVGRFEQYSRYGTFVDARSVDHASLGSRIIRNNGILDGVGSGERKIIHRAILNHSALELEPDEDERSFFFSRLLRDADKLDIWKIMIEFYQAGGGSEDEAVGLNLPDNGRVSDEVLDDLHDHRSVDASNLRSQDDFKLLQIGWVYDINFAPAMSRVLRRGYLQKLRSMLPDDREALEAADAAISHARNSC
ncbi:MAG: HD domain-containing protein [Candidatus Latescibacteria bacterium]|nr:HD domain-containing protein [bacterium]MBD3424539.1 HD domain-containing protein [Candidatus Latescibacterota bacterium]